MKRFTKLLCLSAMLVLLAAPAFAASTPREVHPGLIMNEEGNRVVTIFAYENVTCTTTDHCLANLAMTDDACADRALNTRYIVRPFVVTNLKTSVDSAGDATSTCDMFMEINGVTAGNEETAFSVVTVDAIFDEPQALAVVEGDEFSINVTDDSGCYDNTAPVLTVWVEGYYID